MADIEDRMRQQEEKAAALAEEAKHQELMDEMKPLALSGSAVIVSKTSDAPLSNPMVPSAVEPPLVSKSGE